MAYAQHIGEAGAAATPLVMKEFFNEALRLRGQVVTLYHGPTNINCPCVNVVYNEPDPNCPTCHGTGNISGWERSVVMLAAIFFSSEFSDDQHMKLETRAGQIESSDGRMYIEGRWFSLISTGDLIVYKEKGTAKGVEMMIISKLPRLGNHGEVIYVRCDLEKQPMGKVKNATDVRERI